MTTGPSPSRRAVLRGGIGVAAGAAASAILGACGGSGAASGRPAGSAPRRSAPASTAPAAAPATSDPSAAEWAALAAALGGPLVRPGTPAYPTAVQLYDPRFDGARPQGIAYCSSPADVQRCIGFARRHGLPLAPRSGGHSYGGYSTGPGLVLDVTRMAAVHAAEGRATVGAGTRMIDVYATLNAVGVSIPAGSCPTVGMAGLALGGGAGVVDRAYGLTCDRIASLQVVTADGRVVTADGSTNADLFWACRGGGGGNFGVVTSFEVTTFPTRPLTTFTLFWPWAAAAQVLPAYLEWAPGAPDQLWANCLLTTDPGEPAPRAEVNGVWLGSPADLAPLLDRLQRAAGGGAVASRAVGQSSFARAMLLEAGCGSLSPAACRLPTQGRAGALSRQPSLAKSDYLTGPLGDGGVAAVLAGIEARRAQGARGAVGFDSYGGAVNRVAPDATAFVHRDAIASAQYNADFPPGASPAFLSGAQRWLDDWYTSLRPHVSGAAYQNYIDPGLAGWATAYYGSNLPRLQRVKAAWDPDDVWHFAQSIPLPG